MELSCTSNSFSVRSPLKSVVNTDREFDSMCEAYVPVCTSVSVEEDGYKSSASYEFWVL